MLIAPQYPIAPQSFDGTLDQLYTDHLGKVLPEPGRIALLGPLITRMVTNGELCMPRYFGRDDARRDVRIGSGGQSILFSDNSPNWCLHALLRGTIELNEHWVRRLLPKIPRHMHDVKRTIGSLDARFASTANDSGWYFAHIFDAKGHVPAEDPKAWSTWSRGELVRRTLRNIHPLNIFLFPKAGSSSYSGMEEVRGYCARLWSTLFPQEWSEFLASVGEDRTLENKGDPSLPIRFGMNERLRVTDATRRTSAEASELTCLSCAPNGENPARWTLNDCDSKKHYFRMVPYPYRGGVYYIDLSWKSAGGMIRGVGVVPVEVESLVAAGVLRLSAAGSQVKVAIYHEGESFVLKTNQADRGILLVPTVTYNSEAQGASD